MRCEIPIAVTVKNGRDNVFSLAVQGEDGDIISSLAALTRVTITIGGATIDSGVVGSEVIWWTDTASFRGATVEVISFKLGGQSLTAGRYTGCAVVYYTASLTNGKEAEPPLTVTVED